MTLKITKNYFQTIIASTSSDEGKIKLADMPVSINHTSDLLQMEEDSQRKGKNIQGVYSYLSNSVMRVGSDTFGDPIFQKD